MKKSVLVVLFGVFLFTNAVKSEIFKQPLKVSFKTFNQIVEGKNFKSHFISHRSLIEKYTNKKYKYKTDRQEFLGDIKELIDNGTFEYIGQGTLKKGQPVMEIYRSDAVTLVIKDLGNGIGEWVTALEKGAGLDLGIIMIN